METVLALYFSANAPPFHILTTARVGMIVLGPVFPAVPFSHGPFCQVTLGTCLCKETHFWCTGRWGGMSLSFCCSGTPEGKVKRAEGLMLAGGEQETMYGAGKCSCWAEKDGGREGNRAGGKEVGTGSIYKVPGRPWHKSLLGQGLPLQYIRGYG